MDMVLKYRMFTNFVNRSLILTRYKKLLILEDIWTSLISVDRLDLPLLLFTVRVDIFMSRKPNGL